MITPSTNRDQTHGVPAEPISPAVGWYGRCYLGDREVEDRWLARGDPVTDEAIRCRHPSGAGTAALGPQEGQQVGVALILVRIGQAVGGVGKDLRVACRTSVAEAVAEAPIGTIWTHWSGQPKGFASVSQGAEAGLDIVGE